MVSSWPSLNEKLNPDQPLVPPAFNEVFGTARQLAQQNKNRLLVEAPDDLAR
jgi:hypothetical protein